MNFPPPLRFAFPSVFAAALGFSVAMPAAHAQQATTTTTSTTAAAAPAPEDAFTFDLGHASVDRAPGVTSVYSVLGTTDYASKQKGTKIRLSVVEQDRGGTMTHLLTINTGKYKTVAQLTEILAGIFRKYLDVAPANQEIGKIGDIDHGGEIRFYAESADMLRYDWLTVGEPPRSTRFKRNDIQIFLGILTHPKAAR